MKKPSTKAHTTKTTEKQVADCYSTWGKSYYRDYFRSKTAYPPVHRDIVAGELQAAGAKNLLDAGCGPASMLRDLKFLAAQRYGFDLTPEMVAEARRVMKRQGIPSEQIWQGSVLEPGDFRCPVSGAPKKFDAAMCFGVLPHIPQESDAAVFSHLRGCVKKGGLVLVEARNELFSMFTANRYSYEFMASRLFPDAAAMRLRGAEKAQWDAAVEAFQQQFRMDLPPVRRGKKGEPGYDEVLSRLHNPFETKELFANAGFRKVRLFFYHYHCLPPMFEKEFPEVYRRCSLRLENPTDWRGHFMASAFIVAGEAA